jgi:predicted transposase/invertase (TIGR01784 family)
MQPDPLLYERLFSEIGIYTYRYPETFREWQAIAIYPTRGSAQPTTKVPHELFESGRIQAIFLDELGEIEQLPLSLGLLVLTILEGEEAIHQAQTMMARARQIETGDAIMEMLSTILFYKFKTLSRDEVNAMLGYTLDELKESRAYQEIYAEGKEDGREEERITTQTAIALNLLKESLPLETIARTTGLTIEQIQSLQTQDSQDL